VLQATLAPRAPETSSQEVAEVGKLPAHDPVTDAMSEEPTSTLPVTVSPSPQPQDKTDKKLHTLWKYARDFRHQYTTDAEYVWDDSDYGLAIGRLVIT
jgi:hypothetical protein